MKLLLLFISLAILPSTFSQTIACGERHSISVCANGYVQGWGLNFSGGSGINSPVAVSNLSNIIAVAAGDGNSIALKNDGTVWTWGINENGELGTGSTMWSESSASMVPNLTGIIQISSGARHLLALKDDGTIWSWGYNYNGELGIGSNTNSDIPVQVQGITNAISISAKGFLSMALLSDGTLRSWGKNDYGALGAGIPNNSNIPVNVLSLTNVVSIHCGAGFAIAVLSDSTKWAWGYNAEGQLGNGTTTGLYIPTEIPALFDIQSFNMGWYNSFGVKSDGSIWAWGHNGYGSIGNGTANSTNSSPVEIVGLANIISIGGGSRHTLFQSDNDSFYAAGQNEEGQLGNSNYQATTTPFLTTTVCPTLGVEETTEKAINIDIYPNPSSDILHIAFNSSEEYKLKLYNSNGKLVGQWNLSKAVSDVIINDISSGLYLGVFESNSKIQTKKIIIR